MFYRAIKSPKLVFKSPFTFPNKDAPLTAVKQRDRQPLLKKSPTEKVFDLLLSIVGGKSESKLAEALRIFRELHSKKYTVRQCVQFKKYLSNSPGNAEAF